LAAGQALGKTVAHSELNALDLRSGKMPEQRDYWPLHKQEEAFFAFDPKGTARDGATLLAVVPAKARTTGARWLQAAVWH
jgi:hypothetical protein